jgi:transcriptional regulator GlxA family with amidase domain
LALRPSGRRAIIVRMPRNRERRRVVVVAFPGVQILDVTGPAEVFSLADRLGGPAYTIELVAAGASPIASSGGLRLLPDRQLATCRGLIDTLVVAGGAGVEAAESDERLVAWLRSAARRSRRVTSVCNGAFLLARAGLLEGRRATTHWAACRELARRYPAIEVDADPIFVRDGNVFTSAGVTAGIDLALALVEEDLGRRLALDVARALVLFVRRPGGQAQFSAGLAGQSAERESLRELQDWMADHLDADLSVAGLAQRAFMSPRNFARVFAREVGATPGAYVESLRLERARVLLETTELQMEQVAHRCGFGTVETLRRSFGRRLRVSPGEYRNRFRPAVLALPAVPAEAEVIPIRRAAP